MPTNNNQVETTLADLAVNLVFERTPGLADHYLGFELVPGSQNEEKTRAAGLLGFRVGNEELYIPVLFLNGKVKGTEVLYLKNADVFTSNSKQWVDYLTTKDTGVMGGGSTPRTPLQQPSAQGLSVFSRAPGSMGKMGEFFNGAAADFWNKVASADDWADLATGDGLCLKNVLRAIGKDGYLKFAEFLDNNPPLLAKVAQAFDLEKEVFIEDWPEEKTASVEEQEAELLQKIASFLVEEKGPFFLRPDDIEFLSKEAEFSMTPEQKEQAFTDGFIVLDKRAEDESTLVVKEDYRQRFESPTESGFYEILNSSGSLEKVFVAHQPFMVEDPSKHLMGCLVLDPESGVYVLPVSGEQIFVRSRFSTEEAVWKEKFGKMPSVTSMEPGKSYMLISPSLQVSSPFHVNGKNKTDDGISFHCTTPWCIKYRSVPSTSSYGLCVPASSGGSESRSLLIVDREDESKVVMIGNISYVPSSWKVVEVYEESDGLQYDYGNYPTDSEAQKKMQAEKDKKRKVYFRVLPGNSRTLSAVLANKNIHELTIHKSAGDYTVRFDKEILHRGDKIAALEKLIVGLGLSEKNASQLLDEPLNESGSKQWLMAKNASDDTRSQFEIKKPGMFESLADPRATGQRVTQHAIAAHPELTDALESMPLTAIGAGVGTSVGGALGTGIGGFAGGAAGVALPAWLGSMAGKAIGAASSDDKKTQARRERLGKLIGAISGGVLSLPTGIAGLGAGLGAGVGGVTGALGVGAIGTGAGMIGDAMNRNKQAKAVEHLAAKANGVINQIGSAVNGLKNKVFPPVPPATPAAPAAPKEEVRKAVIPKAAESANDAFERILLGKEAAGPSLNGEGLIYGGMAYPEEDPGVGTNEAGMNEVGPQVLREEIPLNSLSDPSQDWRNMDEANWDKIKNQDLQFLMRVAESGSKPVLETSVINLLLRSNRTSNQIAEWLPDFVNSLDSKCRLLLSFYWHNSDFAEDYGKDEMAEFEDVLLDSIKIDGQLILFLKQRAGESSSSKIDAFAG